jgi:small-conductance mechanosensitive channel
MFIFFASLFPLIIYIDNEGYIALGISLIYILSAIALWILNKAIPSRKHLQPDSKKLFFVYWLVFMIASAILTSVGMSSLLFKINFAVVLLYGFIFGWLGPEVTYRFVGRTNGAIKVGLLICILIVGLAFVQTVSATNPTLEPFSADRIILIINLISIPSMLISRIVLKEMEHSEALGIDCLR